MDEAAGLAAADEQGAALDPLVLLTVIAGRPVSVLSERTLTHLLLRMTKC